MNQIIWASGGETRYAVVWDHTHYMVTKTVVMEHYSPLAKPART